MTAQNLGEELIKYCNTFKVPVEYIMDILIDQKVVPMIRGKATEYDVFLLLKRVLNPREWSVAKLNLNAQTGMHDEDVTVTHQRTGIIIKVECKNACRGSFRFSNRCRIKEPFCKIKCHKSRSDLSKASTTNDRYLLEDFDVVISNMSNAVIAGSTYSENFELIDDSATREALAKHYGTSNEFQQIFDAAYNDWRFAMSKDIAVDGVIPRTPVVRLNDDPNWHPISEIEEYLLQFTKANRSRMRKR